LIGEDYSRRRTEEAILNLLLPEDMRDFNFDLLDGTRLEGYHLAVLCREYPMMHDCRVVLVREAEKIKAEAWEELRPYFEKPSETTVLLFSAAKLDKRRSYYKRISKIGRIVEFKAPPPEQMPAWIESWLSDNGRKISWEQAQTLADQIEPSMNLVVQELEKLLTISQDSEEISDHDIEQCIGVSRDFSVFELTNAFFKRDYERTITIYQHTALSIAPQQLLAALSNSLTRLWSVSRLYARGGDYRSIAAALSLNPWAVKYDLERLQTFTIPEIEQAVKWLLETDEKLKSSSVDHRTFIVEFLFKVSRQRA
jgi:DNA polymerase-3 subunit delta